eukprot:3703750-Pleurochrysis_carterae.AAC.1
MGRQRDVLSGPNNFCTTASREHETLAEYREASVSPATGQAEMGRKTEKPKSKSLPRDSRLHFEFLVAVFAQRRLDGVVEGGVAHAWAVEPREEVADEAAEEGDVCARGSGAGGRGGGWGGG